MDDDRVSEMEHANVNEEEAKKIYIQHRGSSFYMDRSGVYETYRQWNIDPRKEMAWANERIREILSDPIGPEMITGGDFQDAIELIINSKDTVGLNMLVKGMEECKDIDTMSLVKICGFVLHLLKSSKNLRIQEFGSGVDRARCLLTTLLLRAKETKVSVPSIYIETHPLKERLSDDELMKEIDFYIGVFREDPIR